MFQLSGFYCRGLAIQVSGLRFRVSGKSHFSTPRVGRTKGLGLTMHFNVFPSLCVCVCSLRCIEERLVGVPKP